MAICVPEITVPEFILVMGVSGAGKSTVALYLADACGGAFIEADAYHSEENVRSMATGHPLTDVQRWPWIDAVSRAALDARAAGERPVIIACSALKRRYRDRLRDGLGAIAVIHLHGYASVIRQRLEARKAHFMPSHLLESQLADLEAPGSEEDAIVVDINESLADLMGDLCRRLGMNTERDAAGTTAAAPMGEAR